MSVIKTLDASETNEQRQKERHKIEREFKKTDQVLNELVSRHDGDLTKIMQLFGTVSGHVATSRERIHTVKENLIACKQLLCCRREELKKLWMDAMQQKYVLELMEQMWALAYQRPAAEQRPSDTFISLPFLPEANSAKCPPPWPHSPPNASICMPPSP